MTDDKRHDTFMRLFVTHQPAIHSVIRAMVFNRSDADEILQDTVAVLWRKFDDFDPDAPGSRFDHWAVAVARNQVLYFRQKTARDKSRLQFSPDVAALVADAAAVEADKIPAVRDALHRCLAKLPEADRELIRLRYTEEQTNRAVAKVVSRSESAVSRALTRIYSALLSCIRQEVEAEV